GRVVTNNVLMGPSDAGSPLQLIDQDGRRIAVFGGNLAVDMDMSHHLNRVLWARPNGELWVASVFGYRLELYSGEQQLKRIFVRDADWFAPLGVSERPTSGLDGRPPTTEVIGIWEDDRGFLWTVTVVPSPTWRRKGQNSARFERYNSIIE